MFKLLDMVVYNGYGVARIDREVIKKIEENDVFFFELNFINKDVKVLIPKSNIDFIGLRSLHKKVEIENFFKNFLLSCVDYTVSWLYNTSLISWNRRSKDYQSKILSGCFNSILKVYFDLVYISKNKNLSFGEKSVMHQVEDLLSEEISVIYKKSIAEVIFFLKRFSGDTLDLACDKSNFNDNISSFNFDFVFNSNIEKFVE